MSIDTLGQAPVNTPLPDDINAAIENARNSVTIMEAEYTRLQKLTYTEKDSLQKVHEEKTFLSSKIEEIKKEIEILINNNASKKMELLTTTTELENAQKSLREAMENANKVTSIHIMKSASLDARESSVTAREEDLNTRHVNLIERETRHEAKVEKLKRAIE